MFQGDIENGKVFEDNLNTEVVKPATKTITLKKPISSPLEELKRKSFTVIKPNVLEVEFQTKKQKFESFLTYRKRLSRLSLSQAFYFYENFKTFNTEALNIDEEVNEVYRVIIYFYKKIFFLEKYGDNKKNKKLDETFLRNTIKSFILNKVKVDSYIKKHIKKGWCIGKLDSVIKASLRTAICEALFVKNPNFKIITSEYTGLVAGTIFEEKEVAFFNAVLDNIMKEIKKENESR